MDCLVRRKKFEDRIWKGKETFADYYHEKLILANQVPINANEIVSYLIHGIPNKNLRNQVRLQKFATDAELLEAMEAISLPSPVKSEVRKDGRSQHNIKDEATTRQRTTNKEMMEQKTRYYNCGEAGHIAKCTKPKREKRACYTCGKIRHQIKEYPEREKKDKKPSEQILNVIEKVSRMMSFDERLAMKYVRMILASRANYN